MKKLLHLFSSSNEGNKLNKRSKQANDQNTMRSPWKSDSINFGDGYQKQTPTAFQDPIKHRGPQSENRRDSTGPIKYAARRTSFGHVRLSNQD